MRNLYKTLLIVYAFTLCPTGADSCMGSARKCVQDLLGLRTSAALTNFIQRGIRRVCSTLEKSVDCLDELIDDDTGCTKHVDKLLNAPYDKSLQMYDFICEQETDDIEENWKCVADVISPVLRCAVTHGCDYTAATRCSDSVVERSSRCDEDAQDLLQTFVKKYMATFSGCTEDKEVCHLPANHCKIAFRGMTSFEDNKFLKLDFSQICSGILSDTQCFHEITDRIDCGFFPKIYFGESYTAQVKMFSYVCEERQKDISQHWNCLRGIVKDIVKCTGEIGSTCNSRAALRCSDDVINRSRECGSSVKALVRDIVTQKLSLFNNCRGF